MSSFSYFNGAGSVYVCVRKSTIIPSVYRYKRDFIEIIWKTRHKIPVDIRMFLQCGVSV